MQQRSTSVLKWRGKNDKCIQYMKTGDDKEFKEFFLLIKKKIVLSLNLFRFCFILKAFLLQDRIC